MGYNPVTRTNRMDLHHQHWGRHQPQEVRHLVTTTEAELLAVGYQAPAGLRQHRHRTTAGHRHHLASQYHQEANLPVDHPAVVEAAAAAETEADLHPLSPPLTLPLGLQNLICNIIESSIGRRISTPGGRTHVLQVVHMVSNNYSGIAGILWRDQARMSSGANRLGFTRSYERSLKLRKVLCMYVSTNTITTHKQS